MSERIENLMLEATKDMPQGYYVPGEYFEKFAELIVRECNQAVLSVSCYYQDYRAQIEEAVIHDCARAVLEHFNFESEEVTCPRCGLPDSGTSCGIPDCGLVTGVEE